MEVPGVKYGTSSLTLSLWFAVRVFWMSSLDFNHPTVDHDLISTRFLLTLILSQSLLLSNRSSTGALPSYRAQTFPESRGYVRLAFYKASTVK